MSTWTGCCWCCCCCCISPRPWFARILPLLLVWDSLPPRPDTAVADLFPVIIITFDPPLVVTAGIGSEMDGDSELTEIVRFVWIGVESLAVADGTCVKVSDVTVSPCCSFIPSMSSGSRISGASSRNAWPTFLIAFWSPMSHQAPLASSFKKRPGGSIRRIK